VSDARVKLGRQGEELAVRELIRCGYEVVVRTRRGREFGTPEESLTPAKQQRMIDVALTYLGEHDLYDVDWRVGLVAVEMDQAGRLLRLEVYENIS